MTTMSLGIGGVETHIVELCKELAAKGNDITVASNGGVYEKELEESGIKHVKLPLHNKLPSALAKSYFGLKKLIKQEQFDIVHAHARIPAFICGKLAKRLKFRFVTTCHGVYAVSPALRFFSKWGGTPLAVSADIKQYLIKNYDIPYDNITLTINGIDINKFSKDISSQDVENELRLPPSKHRIVYVSRINHDCAQTAFELLEAAPALCKKYDDLQLILVGDGKCFDKLKGEAEKVNENAGRQICWLPGARTNINQYMAMADIFVGVSRSALEAMSAEVPVILSGAQGYIGIFDESKLQASLDTNFCCRGCGISDSEKLKKDIEELFSRSSDKLEEMGVYNRRTVIENYSISRMAEDALGVYRSLSPYKPYKYGDVILCGYYGFRNNGDDQMLRSIIMSLKKEDPDIKITALSATPKQTSDLCGVNSIFRYNVPKIARALRHAKLMICGGGNLITDVTSNRSLYYYTSVIRAAHRLGCKTMLFSGGIGPIVHKNNIKNAKNTLDLMDMITLREECSAELVKELEIKAPVKLSADPAFLTTPAPDRWVDIIAEEAGMDPKKRYFAVSVRQWPNAAHDFSKQIISSCSRLSEKYGLTPIVITMQPTQDHRISKYIADMTGGILLGEHTASEITGILSRCEFIIGMRLHSLIYAAVAALPQICLEYDPKIRGLAQCLDIPFICDVKTVNSDKIVSCADTIMQNREKYSASIKAHAADLRETAEKDAAIAVSMI